MALKVLAPGTPGTETSARLVTHVTLTDTHPPATKFEVSTLICGAVQVSPAPLSDDCAAALAWVWASEASGCDDRGLHAGAGGGLDVALGRIDPSEGDHEDDDDQEDGGDDDQLGDGRALLAVRPAPSARRRSATGPIFLDRGVARGRDAEMEPRDDAPGPARSR